MTNIPIIPSPLPSWLSQWSEELQRLYGVPAPCQQGRVGEVVGTGISARTPSAVRRQRVTYAIQLDLGKPDEAALARVFDALIAARKFKPTLLSVMKTWNRAKEIFG